MATILPEFVTYIRHYPSRIPSKNMLWNRYMQRRVLTTVREPWTH